MRGLSDPRVRGLVSVTKVSVDPDLAEARIFVSVLPAERAKLTLEGLQSAAIRVQRRMREDLPLRRVPHLRFVLDESLKKAASMERALGGAETDMPPAEGGGVDAPEAVP